MAEADTAELFVQIQPVLEQAGTTADVTSATEDAFTDTTQTQAVKEEAEEVAGAQKQPVPKEPNQVVPHTEKRIRCPECKYYTAENEEKMTRHIRKMHRGENPFQCYMCDYSTYNKVCFEEHVRVHQGIKPYKCSFCPHRSVSKKNMKKHELVHRPDNPLKCKHCDFFGRHKPALQAHIRQNHLENPDESDGLSCPTCRLKFEDKDSWVRHNKDRRGCKKCDFVGCTAHASRRHAIKHHGAVKKVGKSKKELFQCALCKWRSSHPPRVLLHLIHHPNQPVDEAVFDLTVLRKHGIVT